MNKKSYLIIALAVAGVLLGILITGEDSKRPPVAIHSTAPEFTIIDSASGAGFSSADFKGKVIFVNFWASWCPPCKEEMPSMEALYREFSNHENFRMITILYKDDPTDALSYLKTNRYTFPVYLDREGISAKNFGVTGVPETYIIDKGGILREKIIGPADWNSPDARNAVRSLF